LFFICHQLDSIDYENNPELKKLQFVAPGPKMAGLSKGTLLPKKEMNIKEGKAIIVALYLACFVVCLWTPWFLEEHS